MNLRDWRRRHHHTKKHHEPFIEFMGLHDGDLVLKVDGKECNVKFSAMVDLSRLDSEDLRRKVELAEWLDGHPGFMRLADLAREYCRLAEIEYKEVPNGVSWYYGGGTRRVTIYDIPWKYYGTTIDYTCYGEIRNELAEPRFSGRYITGGGAKRFFEIVTRRIAELEQKSQTEKNYD